MADTDLEKRGERYGRKKNSKNLYAEQSDEEDDQPQRKPRKRSKAVRSEENDGIEPNDDAFFEEGALEDTEPYEENEFEPGQIVRVYVQDFMCHHKLTIDFGRHVNFVTGANGSGKSAVVAAIQLCLGATARNTGRGTNLGGLIREGSDGPAIMRVTLLNEGPDAYKAKDYGNRITVERRINKGGGGGYRLLSANGTIMANERKELEKMLRAFNIYVDNPVCVLTQEESKKFIQGQEREKYDFYLKATGLERTKEELVKSEDLMTATQVDLDRTEASLQGKQDAMNVLKKELVCLMALDTNENDAKDCLVKLEWVEVYAFDAVLEQLEGEKKLKEKEVTKARAVLQKAEDVANENNNFDNIEAKKKESLLQEDLDSVVADIAQNKQAIKQKNAECIALQTDVRMMSMSKAEHFSRLSATRQEIAALRARALENANANERELLEKIELCTVKIDLKLEEEKNLRDEATAAAQSYEDVNQEYSEYGNRARSAEMKVQQTEGELRKMSDTSQGRSSLFGRSVPEILQAMRNTRFKDEAIGPLGMHIKIADNSSKWAEAVEKAMGRMLSAFIVTNTEDQNTLMNILRRLKCDTSHTVVCQGNDPAYVVQSIPNAHTVCDAITVENPKVFNCLIDQTKMEQTILVQDEEDCNRYFGRNNGLDGFNDHRIKAALTARGTRIEFRFGNQGTSSNNGPFRRLLVADVKEALAALAEQLEIHKRHLQTLHNDSKGFQTRIEQSRALMQREEHQLKEIRSAVRHLTKKRNDIQSELAEIKETGIIDTTPLEVEEVELKEAIEKNAVMEEELKSTMTGKQSELKGLKDILHGVEERRSNISAEMAQQEQFLQRYIANAQLIARDVEKAKRGVLQMEKVVNDIIKVQDAQLIKRQDRLDAASATTRQILPNWDGEPIKTLNNETKERLSAKIISLQKQVERGRREAGLEGRTKTIVSEALMRAKDDLRLSSSMYTRLSEELTEHRKDAKDRQALWKNKLEQNAKTIKSYFHKYLQKKGFEGKVVFKHKDKTLHLECQTDNTNEATKVKDVRQLSGGERSYTTLCLLLALGHVIETPFRLMDEYDVFLDEVSRKVTLDELQQYALDPRQRGRQLLIITPNSLNDVKTSNKVRIKRMAPPSRSSAHGLQQQVLDFPAAN